MSPNRTPEQVVCLLRKEIDRIEGYAELVTLDHDLSCWAQQKLELLLLAAKELGTMLNRVLQDRLRDE